MARFGYDHEILERFPNVVGGVIHADGVNNRPAPAELTAAFHAEQSSVRERIGETPLSDLANLVSIRYALPVAVFDQRHVVGGTIVRLAHGGETWADLGSSTSERPEPGEVIFCDDEERVSARRWCWRQSKASAATEDTTEILVTVEGHHDAAPDDIDRALRDLQALLGAYASPATVRAEQLDSGQPAFI
jgi:DNA/RNA-binding domain of Phe-tRNA-synthetase-like protein